MRNQNGKNNGNYKHGMCGTSIYIRWKHIKSRCYNKNDKGYKDYGGRGIKVCDEWLNKENGFINFYNWAINNGYKERLSIDRINNNGNYEPNNCRWADRKTQNNNTRHLHKITYNNETHTLTEWSNILNINLQTLSNRINIKRMPITLAFNKEISKSKKINQYDLEGKFLKSYRSLKEAKKIYGKNIHITDCCQNKRKQAGGYIWRYANENNN